MLDNWCFIKDDCSMWVLFLFLLNRIKRDCILSVVQGTVCFI